MNPLSLGGQPPVAPTQSSPATSVTDRIAARIRGFLGQPAPAAKPLPLSKPGREVFQTNVLQAHIASFLETTDCVSITRVCKTTSSREKYYAMIMAQLRTKTSLSNDEIRNFQKHLDLKANDWEGVLKHCPNLQELRLTSKEAYTPVHPLLAALPKLPKLSRLTNATPYSVYNKIDADFSDRMIFALAVQCPGLMRIHFNLLHYSQILNHCPGLTHITAESAGVTPFSSSEGVEFRPDFSVLDICPNLRYVHLGENVRCYIDIVRQICKKIGVEFNETLPADKAIRLALAKANPDRPHLDLSGLELRQEEWVELATSHPDLISVSLEESNIVDASILEFLKKCPNLQSIRMATEECWFPQYVNSHRVRQERIYRLLPKFEEIRPMNPPFPLGMVIPGSEIDNFARAHPHLVNFHGVKIGNLSRRMQDSHVKKLVKRCKKLRRIDLSSCPEITLSAVKAIFSNCPNVSRINLSGCCNIKVDDLRKLLQKKPGVAIITPKGNFITA